MTQATATILEPDEAPLFAPWDPVARQNPAENFRRLREIDPVHRVDFLIGWVLTRYEDAVVVLRDAERFSSIVANATIEKLHAEARGEPIYHGKPQPPDMRFALDAFFGRSLLFTDRPDHTRLRGLVNRTFTPRIVTEIRPRIERLVAELLDDIVGAGRIDFMSEFANALPATVIFELLQIPMERRDDFKRWSSGIVVLFDPIRSPEAEEHARECARDMHLFFRDLFIERRKRSGDDIVSRLVALEGSGDSLDAAELLAMCMVLLAAGHETTTNLLGNGLYTLLENPDQLARLRANPDLVPSAVEELLRFESPVQGMPRVAMEDCEIGGRPVAAGDYVVVLVGAVNRDPAVFTDPDRLDIGRRDNRHLAFGFGSHFCLGAPLARAEAEIALREILRRAPNLRGDYASVEWKNTQVMRGLVELPVVL